MKRKRLILLLLFLSYPATLVHRVLNDDQEIPISFRYNASITTDLQWYLHDTGIMLSVLLILAAFLLYVTSGLKRDMDVLILILTISSVWVLDVVHYVLWYKQSEWFLLFEGIVVFIGISLMLIRNGKKNQDY